MTGHDRQWELNRRNFQGRWCGTSHWYRRPREGDAAAGPLDLAHPSRTITDTTYAISFSDADTGLWDGSGLLLAPGGRRRLPLSRSTYNRGGMCWQFAGAGGQSSLALDPAQPRFGHELNLFHRRSRSMLVLLYAPVGSGEALRWQLDALAAVAFRCSLSSPADPPRPPATAWRQLLAEQEGWPGSVERLEPHRWPAEDPPPQPCAPFRAAHFALHERTAGFADGLVCSLPEQLPAGAFVLQVGCRLDAERFHQVSLRFDGDQRLAAWELRRFRRP
ncbi:hypothetical protein KBY96_02865 [Cyanobium sp. ATX 6A2]|uniref:hypothetical protein n=1 Tax=Cyanobium sp. ATX 6A2 TaxID=2823700 RepID=UPI0020CE8EE8|nr:hypothetical protein [Cyanobium sp. ATX 6A2]MCP9886877.1 hypothetical protein [Cyanobium sp. ATX 6A2]